MDNHPIPQDVTNFQFRLIGEMTLKQFGYITGAVVCAWIVLASPFFFLFKFLMSAGLVLGGVVLAFVPIDGRPSDLMMLNFIKALFNPTQFIYQKTSQQAPPAPPPMKTVTPPSQPQKEEKHEPNQGTETVTVQSMPEVAKAAVLANTQPQISAATAQQQTQPQQVIPSVPAITQEESKKEALLETQVSQLSHELAEAKEQEERTMDKERTTDAHEKVVELETTMQQLLAQKQDLEQKLIALQKNLEQKNQQVYTPSTAQEPQQTEHVKKIPKQMSAGIGAPLVPDVPNLITGVIKDPRANVLPNILIEIKDKDGNPVRAFKTNQLGQFASATPLLNGVYTISFEDPQGKQSFDSVEVSVNGEVLLPLEIISIDERERLRKELFGK